MLAIVDGAALSALAALANVFACAQRGEKLCALRGIVALLDAAPLIDATHATPPMSTLIDDLRRGLNDLLSSRLDDALRAPALHLVAALCEQLAGGARWLLPTLADGDVRFATLVVGLAAVEVRIIVEFGATMLPSRDALLGNQCALLEAVVHSLTVGDDDDDDGDNERKVDADEPNLWRRLPGSALQSVEQSLRTAAQAIVASMARDAPTHDPLRRARALPLALRFVGAYLAEDECASMSDELRAALPCVLALLDADATRLVDDDVSGGGGGSGGALSGALYLLPWLQRVATLDDALRRALLAAAPDAVGVIVRCVAALARRCAQHCVSNDDDDDNDNSVACFSFRHAAPPGLFVTAAGLLIALLTLARDVVSSASNVDWHGLGAALGYAIDTIGAPNDATTDAVYHVLAHAHLLALHALTLSETSTTTTTMTTTTTTAARNACAFVVAAIDRRRCE